MQFLVFSEERVSEVRHGMEMKRARNCGDVASYEE
jgi:hypothetical protein